MKIKIRHPVLEVVFLNMRQHPKGKSELLPYVGDFVPFIIENIFFDYMDRNKDINTESQHRKQFLPSYCSKQFIMICLIAGIFFPSFYLSFIR